MINLYGPLQYGRLAIKQLKVSTIAKAAKQNPLPTLKLELF
jgi:hypothetical protein